MNYEIIAPPKILQKYVKYFSTLDYHNDSDTPNQIKVFADRYPHLVFQHCDGNSAFSKNGDMLPIAFMSGIKTIPYTCDINYKHTVTTVTFFPLAIQQLFGISVGELNDELVDLNSFLQAELTDILLNSRTHEQRIAILVNFLSRRVLQLNHFRYEMESVMLMIGDVKNETSVAKLIKHFNFSERKLERIFKESIGLTPKFYLRTKRFERSLSLIRKNEFENLSDIAYTLDFTDQSHFIKEFKEFSGYTPKAYLKQNAVLDNSLPAINSIAGEITINHHITH
jgi:AraC-like DNA-binding protein